jgi:glutamine synthetase
LVTSAPNFSHSRRFTARNTSRNPGPSASARNSERAANSGFLADALGADFLAVFLAVKRRECEKFGALVTNRDYEWYLDTA